MIGLGGLDPRSPLAGEAGVELGGRQLLEDGVKGTFDKLGSTTEPSSVARQIVIPPKLLAQ